MHDSYLTIVICVFIHGEVQLMESAGGLVHLGDPWYSTVQLMDSSSVITMRTSFTRIQGRDLSVLQALETKVIVTPQNTIHWWNADSQFPETMTRARCICKWPAWELSTRPCIIIQETHCRTSMWAHTLASLQWHSWPAWGAQYTWRSGSASRAGADTSQVLLCVSRMLVCPQFPMDLLLVYGLLNQR
jgi:hypothetical protein